jgi:hypothetical protein
MTDSRSTPSDRARRVLEVLAAELPEQYDPADLDTALDAARDLLRYRRSTWAAPANPWERLVVAFGVAVLRVESGQNLTGTKALAAVAEVLPRLRHAGVRARGLA